MKNFVKMAFAAIMMTATFISCSEYDDTELREAIDRLNSKVEALENAVADNVSAIQSMVSLGSVQSCKLDSQTGKAVITLLDGRTLSVRRNRRGIRFYSLQSFVVA